MDLEKTDSLINKKTKALIIVHMLGFPGDVKNFLSLSNSYNLPLIEDNCEAIGSKIGKEYCGTLGDIGVLSFDHGKMIATGEGGMIVTNNTKLYKKMRLDQSSWMEVRDKLKKPQGIICLLYTSPSPRDVEESRMPSSA